MTEYPCPNCFYCGNAKTWETTKYLKSFTFMNRDACMWCYNASDDGHEWEYMIRHNTPHLKPVFRDNIHDLLDFWPFFVNPTLYIRGKAVSVRRSPRLAAKHKPRLPYLHCSPN